MTFCGMCTANTNKSEGCQKWQWGNQVQRCHNHESFFLQLENRALFADILTFKHNVLLGNNVMEKSAKMYILSLRYIFFGESAVKNRRNHRNIYKRKCHSPLLLSNWIYSLQLCRKNCNNNFATNTKKASKTKR